MFSDDVCCCVVSCCAVLCCVVCDAVCWSLLVEGWKEG